MQSYLSRCLVITFTHQTIKVHKTVPLLFPVCDVYGLVGWLVGWMVGWLDGWMIGLLVWLVGWLVGWLFWLVGWLVGLD